MDWVTSDLSRLKLLVACCVFCGYSSLENPLRSTAMRGNFRLPRAPVAIAEEQISRKTHYHSTGKLTLDRPLNRMRSKDHLFYLIKSLSKSEKRYFTLDAQKSGRKNSRYLALFHAINQQEVYSEIPLKKEFGRKLGDDKARLYEAILRAMRDYQSKKSYKTRIKELLTDAKILFERKLYEQSQNRLEEAKSLALELQDHLAVLEINLRQQQLTTEFPSKNYGEQIELLITENKQHLEILNYELKLHEYYHQLAVDIRQYPVKLNEQQLAELEGKYTSILSAESPTNASFTARRRFYQIRAMYNRLSGDQKEMFEAFKEVLKSWDGLEKNRQEDFFLFMVDASNVLFATFQDASQLDTFSELLGELESLSPPSTYGQRFLFERVSIYRLLYLINTRNSVIDGAVKKITEGLRQFDLNASAELSILFNLIILLFLNGRYEDCQPWIDKVISSRKRYRHTRQDIQEGVRILKLIVTYQLDDFQKIENTLRTIKRYFDQNKNSVFYNFHQELHKTMQGLMSAIPGEEKGILLEFKRRIQEQKIKAPNGLDELAVVWIEHLLKRN